MTGRPPVVDPEFESIRNEVWVKLEEAGRALQALERQRIALQQRIHKLNSLLRPITEKQEPEQRIRYSREVRYAQLRETLATAPTGRMSASQLRQALGWSDGLLDKVIKNGIRDDVLFVAGRTAHNERMIALVETPAPEINEQEVGTDG